MRPAVISLFIILSTPLQLLGSRGAEPLFVGHSRAGLLKYQSNDDQKYIDTWVHLEVERPAGPIALALRVEIETLTWERIGTPIFWLREARYALVPEVRLHWSGNVFTFHLFHECYHQIDNEIPGTENFNILRFGWAKADYHPGYDYRVEEEYPSWYNRLGWFLFLSSYPRGGKLDKLQTGADFDYDFGGRARYEAIIKDGRSGWVELSSIFIGHQHLCFYQRHEGRVGISLGEKKGILDLFMAYNFYDTTPLRPTQGLSSFGLGFRF